MGAQVGILHTLHSPECYLAEQGRSEYIVHDGFAQRDKLGRKYADGRGMTWHRFRCNCIRCDSVTLVRFDVLMEFIAERLPPVALDNGAERSPSAERTELEPVPRRGVKSGYSEWGAKR